MSTSRQMNPIRHRATTCISHDLSIHLLRKHRRSTARKAGTTSIDNSDRVASSAQVNGGRPVDGVQVLRRRIVDSSMLGIAAKGRNDGLGVDAGGGKQEERQESLQRGLFSRFANWIIA